MSNQLSEFAQLAWAQLLQVTVVASLALFLVRLFFRRRPHFAYVLLLLVVVKCLTPPIWSSPLGMFDWTWTMPSWSAEGVGAMTKARESHEGLERNSKAAALPAAGVQTEEAVAARANLTSERETLGIGAYLLLIWACGTVVCGTYVAATWLRHLKAIHKTSTPASDWLAALSQGVARKVGIKRRVSVVVTSESFGPCCFGVVFPFVVLPNQLITQLITKSLDEKIEPILAHELIHIRRADPLTALFQMFACVLWWFHPLVWLASRQLSREREKCCDEEALAATACDPEKYAQGMLDVLKFNRPFRPAFLASGIRSVDVTRERLEAIMSKRKKLHSGTPWYCWAALVLGAILVVPGAGASDRNSDLVDPQQKDYASAKNLHDAIEILKQKLIASERSEYSHLFTEDSVKASIHKSIRGFEDLYADSPDRDLRTRFRDAAKPLYEQILAGRWPRGAFFYVTPIRPRFSDFSVNLHVDYRGQVKPVPTPFAGHAIPIVQLTFGYENPPPPGIFRATFGPPLEN